MTTLKPGDRVRCIEPGLSRFLELDKIYTFKGYLNDKWVQLEESDDPMMHWSQDRFVLAEQNNYGMTVDCGCGFDCNCAKPTDFAIVDMWKLPKDNCVPDTAKAILDLDRKPLTPAQQAQAEGVARAIQNLSRHENRLGCAGWEP